jgi:hypothetical protein
MALTETVFIMFEGLTAMRNTTAGVANRYPISNNYT